MKEKKQRGLVIPDVPTEGRVTIIPHVPEETEFIEAGAVTIGVEYRVLNYEIATGYFRKVLAIKPDPLVKELLAENEAAGPEDIYDEGVAIHVFGPGNRGLIEYLRFDLFRKGPHYHYIVMDDTVKTKPIYIDKAVEGDPLQWVLEGLRTRLRPMLERAGATELADLVDPAQVEEVLPRVKLAIEQALQYSAAS